jgi:hypothetical protein
MLMKECDYMKKSTIIAIILTLIIIFTLGAFELFPSYSFVIKSNWDIDLPIKAMLTEIYEKDSGTSFHGDGVRYHIFLYQYEDYIDLMFAWSPNEHKTNYYPTTREASEAWLDEISVPADKRPDYSNCASWNKLQNDTSEIIFFWDSDLNRLYIVEKFI